MPGIITHNRILKETIGLLATRKKKSYILKSIESLLQSDEFTRAALFGSIGPNIFDYFPKREKNSIYGSSISYFLHNGGSYELVKYMVQRIYSYKDKNNEWSAAQRAYLYGFISHLISDSIFHPFVFYFSGFPDSYSKNETYYYREQNLLFMYNIDNYFFTSEDGKFRFNLESMFPVSRIDKKKFLNPAVKSYLLESLHEVYPEIFQTIAGKQDTETIRRMSDIKCQIDRIPGLIKKTYRLKRSRNVRLNKFMKIIKDKNLIKSDFIISYPDSKRINKHLLNLHLDRWQYPTGKSGIHYESIDKLLKISCDKIIDIWERIESCIWSKNDIDVIDELKVNCYTGDEKAGYQDMKIKEPVRFRTKYY